MITLNSKSSKFLIKKIRLMSVAVISGFILANANQVKADEFILNEPITVSQPNAEEETSSETVILENFLDVTPPKPGDKALTGKTAPNSFVFITIDNTPIKTIEDPLIAGETGEFILDLSETPLLYDQTIEIESYHPDTFELDDYEGGDAAVTITTDKHPDSEVKEDGAESNSDSKLFVSIDPIFEGVKTIKGKAGFDGIVYAYVNGGVVTEQARIQDGKFELKFLSNQYERFYKTEDEVILAFVSNDNTRLLKPVSVKKLEQEDQKKPVEFTYTGLSTNHNSFTGTAPAHSQLSLYKESDGSFVQETFSDEKGDYTFNLPNLAKGDVYYLVVLGPTNHYDVIAKQVVDGETTVFSNDQKNTVLEKLGFFAKDSWKGDDNLSIARNLHDKSESINGYTKHIADTAVLITSSNQNKKFPLVPIDELGYWGLNFQDLNTTLEKGEIFTISVIDTKTGKVLATLQNTVVNLNEIDEPADRSFDIKSISTDHYYINSRVAPNLKLTLLNGKTKEVVAKTTSDDNGVFEFILEKPFVENDIVYLLGTDEEGNHVIWDAIAVELGHGKPIKKPETKMDSKEMSEKPETTTEENKPDMPSVSLDNVSTENKLNTTPEIRNTDNVVAQNNTSSQKEETLKKLPVVNETTTHSTKALPKTSDSNSLLPLLVGLLLSLLGLKNFKRNQHK